MNRRILAITVCSSMAIGGWLLWFLTKGAGYAWASGFASASAWVLISFEYERRQR